MGIRTECWKLTHLHTLVESLLQFATGQRTTCVRLNYFAIMIEVGLHEPERRIFLVGVPPKAIPVDILVRFGPQQRRKRSDYW